MSENIGKVKISDARSGVWWRCILLAIGIEEMGNENDQELRDFYKIVDVTFY